MKAKALWATLVSLVLGLATAAVVFAQGGAGGPPDAHRAITEYTGPETCATCHPNAAQEVAASVHYQMQAIPRYRVDWPEGTPGGMYTSYYSPWASVAGINWLELLQPEEASLPAQPSGCALCHVGLGAKPNPIGELTEADEANVDCLVCHAPGYQRTVVRAGDTFYLAPVEGLDVTAAAREAQRPTSELCAPCHLNAAGGPNYKHGDFPTAGYDVHLDAGVQCVDCHYAEEHGITGGGSLIARDDTDHEVTCSNCHGEEPHGGEYAAINAHVARIACQTCHIPAYARDPDLPTQVSRDHTEPVYNEATGLYGPKIGQEGNGTPLYYWWNGYMETPPFPVGAIDDPASRIYPWSPLEVTVPLDAETHTPLYIQQGTYQVQGSLEAAIARGVEDAGQPYSGSWEPVTEWMVLDLQHQVAPAAESLQCADCHVENGRLDFAALGYSAERAAQLSNLLSEPGPTTEPDASPSSAPVPTPAPQATTAPEPTTMPQSTTAPTVPTTGPSDRTNTGLVAAIAGGGLLLIVIVVLVLLRRRG